MFPRQCGAARECRSPFPSPSPAWSRALPFQKSVKRWWSARMAAPYFLPPGWKPASRCSFGEREAARPKPTWWTASRWARVRNGWQVAAKLDQPENFWGLEVCPEDWGRLMEIHSDDPQPTRKIAVNKRPAGRARPEDRIRQEPASTYRARSARHRGRVRSALACGSGGAQGKGGPGRRASAAASIYRCRTFHPRWKRNCGYGCAKIWGRKF